MDRVGKLIQNIHFDSHDDLIPLFFTSLFVIVILSRYWKKSRPNDHDGLLLRLPPGPWKLPLIGNLHQLAVSIVFSLPHHYMTDLAKKYGNIIHLRLGQVSAIIISSAEIAEQVLKTHEASAFSDRPNINLAVQVMSYNLSSIITSPCNDYWKEMRKVCVLELLSAKRVQSFASLREEETRTLVQSIRDHVLRSELGQQPIKLSEMIFSTVYSLASRAIMGKKNKHQQEFISLVQETMRLGSGFGVPDLFPSLKFLHHLTSTKSTVNKVHRKMDRILDEIINDHKLEVNESAGEEQDVVAVLLQLQKSGDFPLELTTNHVKAVTLDMYSAATDTSATAIEWAMSELVRNPRAMEKAQFEIRKVLAGKENIEDADMKKLDYLKLVVQETLRLHPPIPLIPRQANEKCKVSGYDIPIGARVLINTWAMGRDPNYWGANADCFEPERFRDSSINFRGTNFGFIPFGAGKRMCAGITFATAAIELPLAQLLYFFNWRLQNGKKPQQLDMTESFGLVARKRIGLELIPIPFLSNSDSLISSYDP